MKPKQLNIVSFADRQACLAILYNQEPASAWITDSANTSTTKNNLSDPLHSSVTVGGLAIPISVHKAVGGESDGAVPGDILCAALASCLDSTLKIIANRLQVRFTLT